MSNFVEDFTARRSTSFAPPPGATAAGRAATDRHEMLALLRQSVAASLAGGIIAASGKPHTVTMAAAVLRTVETELWPAPKRGDAA